MTEEHEAEEGELSTVQLRTRMEEQERQEIYKQFEGLGETEVDRQLQAHVWITDGRMRNLAQAWLREQEIKREQRTVEAAEASADAVISSAKSAKVAAWCAIWTSVIALLAIVWNVWGS